MPQVTITTTVRRVSTVTPDPALPLYQYGDDFQVLGSLRACASVGCPAVMVLVDQPDTIFDLHWQLYLVAINFGMSLNAICGLMGFQKALMNNSGLGNPGAPRANYILRNDLASPAPRLDKLRTFDLNTHTGTPGYRLAFALANILTAARNRSFPGVRSAMAAISSNNALIVQTLNGNLPPPMKPGTRRPTCTEEVKPDDYEILPSTHRHLFLDCSNIKSQLGGGYKIGPFAHGTLRPWLDDGRVHSFFPLVSVRDQVVTPLGNWRRVPSGAPFPSPFTN